MAECISCGMKCSGKRCMNCFKKTQEFKVGSLIFSNKKELDATIKAKIKLLPRNIAFKDEFLSIIINELHEDVKLREFKVTDFKILDWHGQTGKWEFCRDRFRGGIAVLGFFEPINEWHGVTLYPHKRTKNIIKKLKLGLRQKWSENTKKRDSKTRCEECSGDFPQLHHDSITFGEVADKCLKFFTTEELKKGVGEDWWLHENEADALPDSHPAVIEMLRLHEDIKYKWLCGRCHGVKHI